MSYLLMILLALFSANESFVDIEIQAGSVDRTESLICFAIPETMIYYKYFAVENRSLGTEVPVQRIDEQLCFILDQALEAGNNRKYRLKPIRGRHAVTASATKSQDEIQLSLSGNEVLSYSLTERNAPKQAEYYKRNGFIHPLRTPSGKILTDDFPVGHTHQHALFFAWVNTTFKGEKVDFWNQQQETGTVKHKELISILNGNILTGFTAKLEHWSLKHGPVLEEIWNVQLTAMDEYYVLDLSSLQKNITEDTLFINQYHYGGLGIRGTKLWNDQDSTHYHSEMKLLTSEQKERLGANHTKPDWVRMSGWVEGDAAGLLAIAHQDNFRAPQSIRVHPEMPYFCFAPCVDGDFFIAPGDTYSSKYRFVLYDGALKALKAEAIWQDYQNPVVVVTE